MVNELEQKEIRLDETITMLNKKITQMKILNARLVRLEIKKDDFISIAAHELKSPLQPILGFAELVNSGDIDQKIAWEGVIEMTHKLQGLMTVILDANKIDRDSLTLSLSKVNVHELISRMNFIIHY